MGQQPSKRRGNPLDARSTVSVDVARFMSSSGRALSDMMMMTTILYWNRERISWEKDLFEEIPPYLQRDNITMSVYWGLLGPL